MQSGSYLSAVVGSMANTAKLRGGKLGHTDELHVMLNSVVGSKEISISSIGTHCGLAESVQSGKECPHNLHNVLAFSFTACTHM